MRGAVHLDREDPSVAVVKIDRPEKFNALSRRVVDGLGDDRDLLPR